MLSLVVRPWCSLCDAMRAAIAPVAARHGARVVEVDLDAHPEWEERYGERVPVLVAGAPPEGEVLAELTLDARAVERWLVRQPVARDRDFR